MDHELYEIKEYQRLDMVSGSHDVACLTSSVHSRFLVCVLINSTIASVFQYHWKVDQFAPVQYIYGQGFITIHLVEISSGNGMINIIARGIFIYIFNIVRLRPPLLSLSLSLSLILMKILILLDRTLFHL